MHSFFSDTTFKPLLDRMGAVVMLAGRRSRGSTLAGLTQAARPPRTGLTCWSPKTARWAIGQT